MFRLALIALICTTLLLVNATPDSTVPKVCDAHTTRLVGGQTIHTGDLVVENDADNIYVTINTVDGWVVTEYHAWLGTAWTFGTQAPAPGQFPVKKTGIDGGSFTVTIPLTLLADVEVCPDNREVVLAFHAVTKQTGGAAGSAEETSWGEGTPFDSTRWGWYIPYTVDCDCDKTTFEPPPTVSVPPYNRDLCCDECTTVEENLQQTFKRQSAADKVKKAAKVQVDDDGAVQVCECMACSPKGEETDVVVKCESSTTFTVPVRRGELVKMDGKAGGEITGATLTCGKNDVVAVTVETLRDNGVTCGSEKSQRGLLRVDVASTKECTTETTTTAAPEPDTEPDALPTVVDVPPEDRSLFTIMRDDDPQFDELGNVIEPGLSSGALAAIVVIAILLVLAVFAVVLIAASRQRRAGRELEQLKQRRAVARSSSMRASLNLRGV